MRERAQKSELVVGTCGGAPDAKYLGAGRRWQWAMMRWDGSGGGDHEWRWGWFMVD